MTTMKDLVARAAAREGAALKYRDGDRWVEVSYAEMGRDVRRLGKGLAALDLRPGDAVAIFAETRAEWVLADLAAAWAGLVVATIYPSSSKDEARHILENSEARLVFCDGPEALEKVEQVRSELGHLEHTVLFEGSTEGALTLDDLRDRAEEVGDEEFDDRAEGIAADDLFTLIYTSGTTGPPKGCMITHGNMRAGLDMIEGSVDLGADPVFYAFLPLAHSLTRMVELLAIDSGATLGFWQRDMDKLLEDLDEIKPTHFAAVPRIFEKIYNEATGQAGGGIRGKLFDKAVETGEEVRAEERRGERVGVVQRAEYELADRQVFARVRALLGGELRLALTGAAPVAKEMLEFFDACGILVLEGWGLTESCAVGTFNTPERFKFGTQGHTLGDCEVRLAERSDSDEDGDEGGGDETGEDEAQDPGAEILVRGPNLFQGYYKMPEETDEAIDSEGWFHTGDVGSFDADGFLTITGRTKDIIVTSSGKNIPAASIENAISQSRWIAHAVVYGDDKNYLVALVTLDEDERAALAEQAGVSDDLERMATSDAVREEIEKAVDAANENFARIEQVKKFDILQRDLSADEGELTPTMKVKRSVVYDNHRDTFEALYDDGSGR